MKNRVVMGAVALVALMLAGCGSGTSGTEQASSTGGPSSAGSGADSGKKLKLAFVTNNSSDYWTIASKGVDKAKSENPNLEVDVIMPAEGTAAAQQQIIDDLMTKGVDGIAISPVDPANQTEMINKAAAKAMVFTQDSDAPNTNRACYVGSDNMAAGKMAGEELKKALPNGGKVYVFVGKSDAQNAKDRIDGLKSAIEGSNIQIVDVRTDDADHARAKTNAADVLVKDPSVSAMVGIWSYNGPAIYNAVKEANKVGQVKIVCFDEEDDTLAGIKDGAIAATIVQAPFEIGYQSITMLAKALNGDKSVIPDNKLHIIPTKVVNKDNVDSFKTDLDKLRGRS